MKFFILCLFSFALSILLVSASHSQAKVEEVFPKYFPSEIKEFSQRWYSKHLKAMKEVPIYKAPAASEKFVFRLLWLRSFHHPVCVRVEKNGDSPAILVGKELSGKGGYGPGELVVDRKIEMSAKSYEQLRDLLKSSKFAEQPIDQDKTDVNDGAMWLFEMNDKGQYHIVNSFAGGAIRDIGIYLLKEAKLLPEKHVY